MSGVFLSYSRADRALAAQVVKGLRALGLDVWWDEDMPGVDWQEELERQINDLAAVLVLWTPTSRNSKNVRDEARLGQNTDKLVNILAGVPAPPFPFDRFNGLPLDGWTGSEPHGGWARMVETIEEHLVKAGSIKPGALTDALKARERALRDQRQAYDDAEAAYAAAKADEDAAAVGGGAADAAFQAAEEQLSRLVAMHATPAVLRAAQSDLDAAQAAKLEANRQRKAASAALSAASRDLTSAKAARDKMLGDVAPPPGLQPHAQARASGRPTRVVAFRAPPATEDATAATASPLHATRITWLVAGVGLGVVLIVVGPVLLSRHAAPPAAATAQGSPVATPAPTKPAPVSAPGLDPRAAALIGEWSGNGATCDDPLAIIVRGKAISEVMSGATQKGAITTISDDGMVSVAWPDGAWTYKVVGDTLSMTPAGGAPMSYQRCAG